MAAMTSRDTFSRLFVPVSLAEGVSFLVLLLVGMPLQIVGHQQTPVMVFGMLHGVLFIAYVFTAAYGYIQRKWTGRHMAWILLMAVLPTGAFFAERAVRKEVVAPVAEPVAA
jgi:integral membrane protein